MSTPLNIKVNSHYAFLLIICVKAKNGFHSLYLRQHPIDTMLQFDANANAHADANINASVNGPLKRKDHLNNK